MLRRLVVVGLVLVCLVGYTTSSGTTADCKLPQARLFGPDKERHADVPPLRTVPCCQGPEDDPVMVPWYDYYSLEVPPGLTMHVEGFGAKERMDTFEGVVLAPRSRFPGFRHVLVRLQLSQDASEEQIQCVAASLSPPSPPPPPPPPPPVRALPSRVQEEEKEEEEAEEDPFQDDERRGVLLFELDNFRGRSTFVDVQPPGTRLDTTLFFDKTMSARLLMHPEDTWRVVFRVVGAGVVADKVVDKVDNVVVELDQGNRLVKQGLRAVALEFQEAPQPAACESGVTFEEFQEAPQTAACESTICTLAFGHNLG